MNKVLGLDDLKMTPKEIARAGWSVVIPGDLYHELCNLLEYISTYHSATIQLHGLYQALIGRAKPVRAVKRS